MKKNLLLTAALVATSATCGAQQVNADAMKSVLDGKLATKATAQFKAGAVAKAGSLKAPASATDGVFYHRPEGTMYSGYTFGDGGAALHVPAITDVTYVNGCNNPKAAKWSINGSDMSENTDENNNLIMNWPAGDVEYGYGAFYSPTLTVSSKTGNKSFELTYVQMTGLEMMPMFRENLEYLKLYTGFTDGPAWGTGSVLEQAILEQTDAIPEAYIKTFEKPNSPLCIESFELMFWTESNNPLPAGKKVTMNIYKLDENGKTVGDPVETLYCEEAEIEGEFSGGDGAYGSLIFAKTEVGVFGETLSTPIVIDYAFAIELFGHNEEGVDLRYRLADLGEEGNEYELIYGGPDTFVKSLNPDGTYSNYYWYNDEQGYGYVLPIQLNALYDKVIVETDMELNNGGFATRCNVIRVSADGQTITTDGPEDLGGVVYVDSALPFFAMDEDGNIDGENYELVDCPDWVAFGVDNSYWADYNINLVFPDAVDPLPEGVTGRTAVIYIKGQGYTSDAPIVILQGDAEWNGEEGIQNIVADTKKANKINISGQKVSNDYKGFVISNGKKLLNK